MNKEISFFRGWKCWLINNLTFQASKCINSSYNDKHSKFIVSLSSLWGLSRSYDSLSWMLVTFSKVSSYMWVVHQGNSLIFSLLVIFLLGSNFFCMVINCSTVHFWGKKSANLYILCKYNLVSPTYWWSNGECRAFFIHNRWPRKFCRVVPFV